MAEDPKPAFTAESVLGDERAAAEMADADLRERIRAAEELAASDQTPRRQRRQLQEKLAADQAELNARIAASTGVAVQNIDVSSKAGEITGDSRKAADLSDDELRERIQQTRGLLALEELSDDQTQALRQVLDNDRAEIRSRVAARDTDQRRARRDDDSDGGNRSDELPMRGDQLTLRDLLEDDRPADDLTTDALERRIDANRRALRLDNLNDRQRTSLRERMRDDRQALRGRLGDRRERRRARLDDPAFALAVAVGAIATAAILSRPNIAAAEAYDEEIEDWLTAAPLVETERRYRFEDFRDQPRLRYAVPGIEVDTVRFGFGEGFLREEEIPKLDRIGATIERIVAGNPDEVFMIEGHTDAVGTEAANMKLSEERAEAVKQALLEYFNIGEENLVTVGRGELYPKIPTQAAEAENRRVSVRRITPLLARN
ncbi:MAG: OmpA family protein [Anderseniella sp.]|nr:OmpA family protein [Anderseniella sp.]